MSSLFLLLIILQQHVVFLKKNFVSSHMYPENVGGTQVIVGSMNMGSK